MRTAIIINDIDNESLLRFTETKLFFDASNQAISFVDDCLITTSLESAKELATQFTSAVILRIGEFLTTNYRQKHNSSTGVLIATGDEDVIVFDAETYIGFKKRCHYLQGSKQLYIIENLLKTCIRSNQLVYLTNTEEVGAVPSLPIKHLYGLASGWKTIQLAEQIGFDALDSITVYDINPVQLQHARWLHSHAVLPHDIPAYKHECGEYNSGSISVDSWKQWHAYPVKFVLINLFNNELFPADSLIWVSNVFHYEPTIFKFGFDYCKRAKNQLIDSNKDSIIL
jgi:hypothetical protein